MKRSLQYTALIVYVLAYASAFAIAYLMTRDDPDLLSASLSFIASSMLFTALLVTFMVTSGSNRDRYAEYVQEREGKEQDDGDDHSS